MVLSGAQVTFASSGGSDAKVPLLSEPAKLSGNTARQVQGDVSQLVTALIGSLQSTQRTVHREAWDELHPSLEAALAGGHADIASVLEFFADKGPFSSNSK